jgi:hypothetical protein
VDFRGSRLIPVEAYRGADPAQPSIAIIEPCSASALAMQDSLRSNASDPVNVSFPSLRARSAFWFCQRRKEKAEARSTMAPTNERGTAKAAVGGGVRVTEVK